MEKITSSGLARAEFAALQNERHVATICCIPSPFGPRCLRYDPVKDTHVHYTPADWMAAIEGDVGNRTTAKEAVLVVMQDAETIQSFKKERPQLRNAKELTEHTPDAQRTAAIVSATQPGSVTFVSSRCTTLAPFICMGKSGTVTVLQTFCSSSTREQLELMERTACCGCQGNYLMHVCTQHLEATLWARDTGAGVVAATAEDVKKEVEAEAAAGRLAALIEEKREAAAARKEQAHGLRSSAARQLGAPASEWLGRLMQNCGCSANTSQVNLVVGACRAVMEKRDELVVALVECSSVTASNQVWPIMCQAVNKLAAEIPKCREAPSTLSLITFGDTAKELSRRAASATSPALDPASAIESGMGAASSCNLEAAIATLSSVCNASEVASHRKTVVMLLGGEEPRSGNHLVALHQWLGASQGSVTNVWVVCFGKAAPAAARQLVEAVRSHHTTCRLCVAEAGPKLSEAMAAAACCERPHSL